MDVLHLGGGRLGERVLAVLREHDDRILSVSDREALGDALAEHGSFEWMVSAGFRYIVSEPQLAAVKDACNVHTSLLPWGRGAHPNVWMLADGEPAGVTVHRMVAAVDAGPIFAQRRVPTTFADTAASLYDRLQDAAVDLFAESWPALRNHDIEPEAQPNGGSYHVASELTELADIALDEQVTWEWAMNVMRALTFPPHRNLVVERNGRRFHVEIDVTELDDQ